MAKTISGPDYYFRLQNVGGIGRYASQGGSLSNLEISRQEWLGLGKSEKYNERSRYGGPMRYFRTPTPDDAALLAGEQRDRDIQGLEDLYNSLDKVPAFARIKREAEGGDVLSELFDKAFGKVASESLGAAAPSGLLRDQAPALLAGTALQYASMEDQMRSNSEQQLLGLIGAPGYGGRGIASPSDYLSHVSEADSVGRATNWYSKMFEMDAAKDAASVSKRWAGYGLAVGTIKSAAGAYGMSA